MAVQAPTILSKETHGDVIERVVGISNALDVRSGNSQAVRLQGSCARQRGDARNIVRKAEGRCGEAAKIHVATEVEFEDLRLFGAQLDEVVIAADFESVAAANERQMVREFEAALDAVHGGVGLSPKISKPGDVDADVGAAWKRRVPKVQAAARDLRAELVEDFVGDDGVVLEGDV